ncbi:MAG: hypothetical protein WCJ37_02035 [Syntrophus sp. (in: bacteria)]
MAKNIGKQRWTAEPELLRQFHEGRSHITCPKCHTSLGDAWEEKGKRSYQYVVGLKHQFQEGRRHITCPRCSFLLGEVYWLPPTLGERIQYVCEYTTADMSFRTRWVVALIFAVAAIVVPMGIAVHEHGRLIVHFSWEGIFSLCVIFLVVFGFVWLFLSPGSGRYAADDDWLYWFNQRH